MDDIIYYQIIPRIIKHQIYEWETVPNIYQSHYIQVTLRLNKQWNRNMRKYILSKFRGGENPANPTGIGKLIRYVKIPYFDSPRINVFFHHGGYNILFKSKKFLTQILQSELIHSLSDEPRKLFRSCPMWIRAGSIEVENVIISDSIRLEVGFNYSEYRMRKMCSGELVATVRFSFNRSLRRNDTFTQSFYFTPTPYLKGISERVGVVEDYLATKGNIIIPAIIRSMNIMSYYKYYF